MPIALTCPSCHTPFEAEESRLRASYGWASCPACSKVFIGVQNMMYKGEMADFRITDREQFQKINPRNMPAAASRSVGAQSAPTQPQAQRQEKQELYTAPISSTATPSLEDSAPREIKKPPLNTELGAKLTSKTLSGKRTLEAATSFEKAAKMPQASIKQPDSEAALTQRADAAQPILKHSWGGHASSPPVPPHTATVPTIPGLLEVDEALRQAVETGVFPGEEPPLHPALLVEDEPITPPKNKGRKRTWFLVLCILLAYVYFDRSRVAAFAPWTRPLLEQACEYMSCKVEPLYDLGQVTKESDSFIRLAGRTPEDNLYRLEVTFNNNSQWLHYAVPLMDLEITDIEGNIIDRQTIDPRSMAPDAIAISPQSKWSGKVELELKLAPENSQRIAGYAIRPKYPERQAQDNPISNFLEQLFATRP